jgi:hypothetical protein
MFYSFTEELFNPISGEFATGATPPVISGCKTFFAYAGKNQSCIRHYTGFQCRFFY